MDRSNLIVNYLPTGFTEKDLELLFSPFGSILSVKVEQIRMCPISLLRWSATNIQEYQWVSDL